MEGFFERFENRMNYDRIGFTRTDQKGAGGTNANPLGYSGSGQESLPDGGVGDGGCKADVLMGNRVFKFDGASMKADTSIGIATAGTILQVAFDRATYRRQLATDLMMPACL